MTKRTSDQRRRRFLRTVAAVGALSLAAAACGSDEAEPASDAATTTEAEGSASDDSSAAVTGSDAGTTSEGADEPAASGDLEFATVVKLTGIGWFDRMEQGVADFAADTGISAFQQGPSEADAALQVQVIEDLIARGVDAINVVPFQPDTLEPVLQKARDAGIVVVAHEGASLENVDYDIEAFDNAAYGRHLMDLLADEMGAEGEYAVMVGSLTSETHNIWVDSAIEYQKETYPNMTWVGDKVETTDDAEVARQRTEELLAAFPNLAGIQGSSSVDVVGAGQAIEEAGLQDSIAVVGTSIPSIAGDLLETGAIDVIAFWDPALAGYAMNVIAQMVVEGQVPTDGMDLGLAGYESITIDGTVISGSAWVDVTIDNMAEYPF